MTIRLGNRLLDLTTPVVMGILNITPDSFFDGGTHTSMGAWLQKAETMLSDGAALIDLGGQSTRPGAVRVSEAEETNRVMPALECILKHFPEAAVSVDTFYAGVARRAVQAGAVMINDVSGGQEDPSMWQTVAELGVPYVLMHRQGNAETMQVAPHYANVVTEVLDYLVAGADTLQQKGVADVILDPGFGFGKTLEHNFALLKNLHVFLLPGLPVMAGLSRKSMINRVLGTTPETALNGTTALNMLALTAGASLLRVHDVKEAVQAVKLFMAMKLAGDGQATPGQ